MGGIQGDGFDVPTDGPEQAAMSTPDSPPYAYWSAAPLAAVLDRNRPGLLAIAGVHGVAEGRSSDGLEVVRIDVDSDAVRRLLPPTVEGFPVQVVVVAGGFGALPTVPGDSP